VVIMVEDFDEIGSWPSQLADITDQRLDVRRLRLVGTLSRTPR
jgi:hypothetical protein